MKKDKSENLKDKVESWLQKQGYPFEMEVASVFHAQKMNVRQSDYFIDPESQKSLEIDVIAEKNFGSILIPRFCLRIIIECKVLKKHPWVFFCSEEKNRQFLQVGEFKNNNLKFFIALNKKFPEFDELRLFKGMGPISYGITTALRDEGHDKDLSYSTCLKVAKASIVETDKDQKFWGPKYELCVPLIVVRGEIFSAILKNGCAQVEECGAGVLSWKNKVLGRENVSIQILQENKLAEFCNNVKEAVEFFQQKVVADFLSRDIKGLREIHE